MIEIRYICGTHTRDNEPVPNSAFPAFEAGLAKAFGGFTRTEGNGGYIMADGSLKLEPCVIYDVAVPEDLLLGMAESLASQLANAARQECVYFRDARGKVHFLQ